MGSSRGISLECCEVCLCREVRAAIRLLTVLLVSRRFEGPFDDRSCLAAHDGGAILVEVDRVVIEVEMPDHEAVLVVDKNFLRFDEGVSDGIPGVDAGIGGAARCVSLDWSDGGPYELTATGKRPNGSKEHGKARLELCLRVAPAVHAVVEMNDGEGDSLRGGELGDLAGKTGITNGRGGGHEVDVGDAAEILGDLREIVACDGIAKEQDIRKFRIGMLGTDFPRPLDLFGNRGRPLGAKGRRLDQNAERKDKKRSQNNTTRGGLQVRLRIALSKADGHRRFPEDAKLIKKMAYRLPTVNRTVATARLAMTELSSSLAE